MTILLLSVACAMPPPLPESDEDASDQAPTEDVAEPTEEVAEPKPDVAELPDGQGVIACETAPDGMVCVEGGAFVRGVDKSASICPSFQGWPCATSNAWPEATVYLQTFYMDQTEVTFEAYKECVAEGACRDTGPNYTDFSRPTQPITGVSWFDAVAYCEHVGKHLPTEAQWEAAARGPEGHLYPWGEEVADCDRAVIEDERGRSCGVKKTHTPDKGRPMVVKSRPAERLALYDMMGNVQEWVYDWYSKSYDACGEDCLGVDPKGPCDGAETCPGHEHRVMKGGSWYWEAPHANAADRRWHFPSNNPFHHLGFRCAASVEEADALSR